MSVKNSMNSPFIRQKVFLHTGHIGDIIAFIPIYKALGGTKLLIKDEEPWMAPMSGYKYDSLEPLLLNQGIDVVFNENTPSIDYNMSPWRACYEHKLSLMDAQARYVGLIPRETGHMKIDSPWISVEDDRFTKGRVIFNRSHRYRNGKFPWNDVAKHFGNRALFIGTEEEHEDFCDKFGKVEYYKTKDCLQVARAISGADFFVGNQSSAFWIAAALHKPLIQETFELAPNSIVPYKNAVYCMDGKIDFSTL